MTESFWIYVDKHFSYETTIMFKHLSLIVPFVIATFVGTMFLCSWLFFRIRRQETLTKVSLLRVPAKGGKNEYYTSVAASPLEVLESMCTYFFWHVLFKKKTIAFRDYAKARRTFRILLVIILVSTLIGVLSVCAVIWYPDPQHAH
ncbi:hypothetical protein [Bacillus pseudomycoides]|nr:hypothetical protein [Bacillus pseudomycoides]